MYAVGGFDFPTVTGNYSVTGVGFQPVGVVMFGGNRSEVGSLVTGATGPGVFMSFNAYDYSATSTIRSFCLSLNGNSDASNANYRGFENGPISMQTDTTSAGTVDYRADSITFDSDGFTIHVSNAAGSRRPIHWMAFGGDISADDATAMVSSMARANLGGDVDFTNSYSPRSILTLYTIGTVGFGEAYVNNECYFGFGSGHYPARALDNPNDWQSATTYANIQLYSALGRQGFTEVFVWPSVGSDPDSLHVASTIGALGPVLNEGYRNWRPKVESAAPTTMRNTGTVGSSTYNAGMWWNGEGWTDFVDVPDDDSVTVTHPANFEAFEAILFSTINGSSGSGGSTPQRFGFGILGPSYQGCVVFGQDGSFYQSVTRAAATCAASGANTASGTISGGYFTLTNEEGGALGNVVYHAFGSTKVARWIPHIYRRLRYSASRSPVPEAEYLLLTEDGFRIVLEDDSGFLILE